MAMERVERAGALRRPHSSLDANAEAASLSTPQGLAEDDIIAPALDQGPGVCGLGLLFHRAQPELGEFANYKPPRRADGTPPPNPPDG